MVGQLEVGLPVGDIDVGPRVGQEVGLIVGTEFTGERDGELDGNLDDGVPVTGELLFGLSGIAEGNLEGDFVGTAAKEATIHEVSNKATNRCINYNWSWKLGRFIVCKL